MSGDKSKNKLKIEVISARGVARSSKKKSVKRAYVKLILWDGDVRLKARTDEIDPSDTGVAIWNQTLELSHITSDRPKVDIFVVRKTSVGKAKNLAEGHLDTKTLDPAGIEQSLNIDLEGDSEGYIVVKATWNCPRLARLQEEERKRRAEERRKMLERALAEAGRYFINFVEEIKAEDGKEEDRKDVGTRGSRKEDNAVADKQLSWARCRLKKVEKFLQGVQTRFDRHPKYFKHKTSAFVEGPANTVIVNSCMRSFEAFPFMKQKDFKLVLGVLSLFIRLWPKYGGKVAKELTVMELPIIRHFCLNCEKSLRLVIERVFCQISLEAPILRRNGRFETNGPRDLFTVLRSHVGGLLPHIEGVAVLELAQFEQGLLSYFQSLFRHRLRCVHFNKHDSVEGRPGGDSKQANSAANNGVALQKKTKSRSFWSSRRFSAHMVSHGPHDVGGIRVYK